MVFRLLLLKLRGVYSLLQVLLASTGSPSAWIIPSSLRRLVRDIHQFTITGVADLIHL